jgi:histidine triad (HIT) family protein
MVITKVHSPTILELPGAEVGPLFEAVQLMARRLTKAVNAHGLTIGMNQGSVTGQEVGHLHVHLMPRFEGDGGGPVQSLVKNEPIGSLEEMVAKIRSVPA